MKKLQMHVSNFKYVYPPVIDPLSPSCSKCEFMPTEELELTPKEYGKLHLKEKHPKISFEFETEEQLMEFIIKIGGKFRKDEGLCFYVENIKNVELFDMELNKRIGVK